MNIDGSCADNGAVCLNECGRVFYLKTELQSLHIIECLYATLVFRSYRTDTERRKIPTIYNSS